MAVAEPLPRYLTMRLPESVRAELERRAELFGGKPAQVARKLIIDGLKKTRVQG